MPAVRPRPHVRRWLFAALVCLAIAVPLLVPTFTLHRARARILGTLARQLGRPVAAASLHLVLLPWPGFELDGLRLSEAPQFGLEDLASADNAVATLRLLPLWRGRIEFSSVRLDHANINLARNAAGRWNLAALLDRAAAAAPPLRPTGAPAVLGAPERFPYFEIRDSRVNFKFGLFKRSFYLDAVNGSLTLEPTAWRIHLRFVPQRSDLRLSDTGEVTLDGRWQRPRGGRAFRDLRFDVTARYRDAYLAGASPLLLGHEAGVHGILAATVHLAGTGEDFAISGVAGGAALRRWDQLPTRLNLSLPFAARYRAGDDTLLVERLGGGAHWSLAGTVSHLLTHPTARFECTLAALPAARWAPVARALDRRLPQDWRATGTIGGAVAIASVPGARLTLAGSLHARDLVLADDDAQLGLSAAACHFGPRLSCQARGRIGAATLALGAEAADAGLHVSLAGSDLEAAGAQRLAALLGIPDLWPASLSGRAQAALALTAPWAAVRGQPASSPLKWRGRLAWRRALWRAPELAAPLPLRDLGLTRLPDGEIKLAATALLGGEPWQLSASRRAAAAPSWHFTLTAEHASAAAVAAALRPASGGFFADWLGNRPSLAPLLDRLHAQGNVQIGSFAWRHHHATVRVAIAADGPEWRLAPITLALAGGRIAGEGAWRGERLRLHGRATGLALARLLADMPGAAGLAGTAEATLRVETPLPIAPDRFIASGRVALRSGPLRYAADLAWRDGALQIAAPQLTVASARRIDPVPTRLVAASAGDAPAATSRQARAFRAQLDRIAANAASPPPHPAVVLTAAEAEAYFASPLSPLPPAISHLTLASRGEEILGAADVDFDRLARGSQPSLAGLIFAGVHHIAAVAHLDSGLAPAAQLTVTQVSLDGQRIPNALIDLAIREFVQPRHPEISRHLRLPLPAEVRSVTLGADQATLHY